MKVLQVIPSFYPAHIYGGPVISVYNLCRGLARLGCKVRVLTTDANGPDAVLDVNTSREIEITEGVDVRYCHRIIDVSISPGLIRLLPSYIREADVVHLTAVYSFPTIPTLLLCRMMNKPVVWSPRGMLQRWEGSTHTYLKTLWERLCRAASSRDMVLHLTSEEEAVESKPRMPGAETVVIPNGIEIPDEVVHRESPNELRLVFLGRIHPKKGIENLLAAFGSLNGRLRKASLTIAGDGDASYLSKIQSLISSRALSSRVRMIGPVTGQKKRSFFENADLMIVPSYTENFGLVVAEALAHGVPVIASTGTPWSRINEIGCGMWIGNTPDELAAGISRISQMPLREMGGRGREWMIREFSWDLVAKQILGVYESVARRKVSPGYPLNNPC